MRASGAAAVEIALRRASWRYLSAVCLLLPGLAFADDSKDAREQALTQAFVAIQLADAKSQAAEAWERCNAPLEAKPLPVDIFDSLDLTAEQQLYVQGYFSARLLRQCTETANVELLQAAYLARDFKLPGNSPTDDPDAKEATLAISEQYRELTHRAAYYALVPESKRQQIEQIEALKHPFKWLPRPLK